MKLKSFLVEENLASADISKFTNNISIEDANTIKKLFNKFKTFNKIESLDVQTDQLTCHVTNGLIDLDFTIISEQRFPSGKGTFFVEIASMVNSRFVFNCQEIYEHEFHLIALTPNFSRDFDIKKIDRLLEYADYLNEVTNEFSDWYFELSSKYGKVKLKKTTYDIDDESSGSKWRWVPVCGSFFAPSSKTGGVIEAKIL